MMMVSQERGRVIISGTYFISEHSPLFVAVSGGRGGRVEGAGVERLLWG